MKIIDAQQYIESCRVFEKSENRDILNFVENWLDILKEEINIGVLSPYYISPEPITPNGTQIISNKLNDYYGALNSIFENMKYIPIQPPAYTLRTMVNEIDSSIPDELKISNIYFKNITQYNFTESKMNRPGIFIENTTNLISSIPNVLSMTVIYHQNPLMWPLIFHEYGHTIYTTIKKQSQYTEIRNNIIRHCKGKKLNVPANTLESIISEAFSDLFAINHYRSNYLFAFYFHEILRSDIKLLLNLRKKKPFEIEKYPPSAIRFKQMVKELNDKEYDKNDEALEKLLEYHKPYQSKIDELIQQKVSVDFIEFYNVVYTEISKLFPKNDEIDIDLKLIDILHKNLYSKQPVSTSHGDRKDLKMLLQSNQKKFDIEVNNKIIDIIYSAWKYLILDIIIKLYGMPDYEDYLENSEVEIEKGTKKIEILFSKFNHEYKFLNRNINYSIETSLIVSNHLEDSKL